jgi:DME family drug/metabolite transporter
VRPSAKPAELAAAISTGEVRTDQRAPAAEGRSGLLLIVLAACLWGTTGVATRGIFALAETSALTISFWRLLLAAPLLVLACHGVAGSPLTGLERRSIWLAVLSGPPTMLSALAYAAAIPLAGVAIATIITLCAAPPVAAVGSALLFRERLSGRVILALVAALGGTALLVAGSGAAEAGSDSLTGSLLALLAAMSYAVSTLLQRLLAARCHPLQIASLGMLAALLSIAPVVVIAKPLLDLPPHAWLLVGYIALFPTVGAYVLLIYGLRSTSATVATIVTLLEAVVGTALAYAIFGERLAPTGVMGALLLVAAIAVLYRRGCTRRGCAIVRPPAPRVSAG